MPNCDNLGRRMASDGMCVPHCSRVGSTIYVYEHEEKPAVAIELCWRQHDNINSKGRVCQPGKCPCLPPYRNSLLKIGIAAKRHGLCQTEPGPFYCTLSYPNDGAMPNKNRCHTRGACHSRSSGVKTARAIFGSQLRILT